MQDFTPVDTVAELKIEDRVPGTGAAAESSDTVTCHYTGAIAKTGEVFQTSHDFGKPISFPLDGVIAGWTKGVPGMKVGGTRRLLIPAAMAYGDRPPYGSGIPAGADLVFDIELVAIEGK
ncbi:MAG TPA: FKBP-type peptidyl-prolyl cis-trans isomerase [Candidatus Saccharimonadales bacterium]|nr:FKBP-type peptidyl-prolyl cis-trans isomerase [Candidatus Saccharimonadales bacterium]